MSSINLKNKKLKIFFTILGALLLLFLLSLFLFLNSWVKEKIILSVEKQSEYKLNIGTITFIGLHGLEITGIELHPKLDSSQFFHESFEQDWIVIKGTVSAEGIDWKALLWHKKFYAEKMTIRRADLYVYRDKKMPDAPYKYKPLFSKLLRDASASVTIPLIKIVKSHIVYEEKSDNGVRSRIAFSKLYGTICHLSTDSAYIHGHPEVIVEGKGIIADSIEANMKYKFNTLNKRDSYHFEGHTGAFSASLLNKYIIPLSGAQISSGHVSRINLFFDADDNMATGKFNIDYDDLRLHLLTKKKRILKLILNALIRNDDKKANGKEKDMGEISCTRDKGKSIFNYWWHAIKSGLIDSVVKIPVSEKKKKRY
jgi:hypothetical protein